jgi:hypothetical protein
MPEQQFASPLGVVTHRRFFFAREPFIPPSVRACCSLTVHTLRRRSLTDKSPDRPTCCFPITNSFLFHIEVGGVLRAAAAAIIACAKRQKKQLMGEYKF